ncbi:MAG: sulfurtransferase TusA family protein [Caulobacter sp.]|nr:sulfurtransferase TusA family protein [Caulobacter sp.]
MTASDAKGPSLNAAFAAGVAPEQLVDARGHHCPVPTLRLRRAMEQAGPGAVVRLLADDPMARIDVPHFAAQAGFQLIDSGELSPPPGLFFVVSRPV